ncbi:MAG: hypothetical protein SGJ10_04070 [Bacteroidota bacterium]|nr:hypothetical protein [Bacteroidota bacterium]
MSALELKVYELFKSKFGENEASSIIEYFESKAEQKYIEKKDVLATKEDLSQLQTRLTRSIFIANTIQFIATIASIVAIIKMIK